MPSHLPWNHWILRITILSLLLASLLGPLPQVPGRSAESVDVAYAASAGKIDPAVWKALEESPDGQAEALVYLKAQADLSFAESIDDWNARGWAVYNALRATADNSQGPVLDTLARAQTEGHATRYKGFWIVNLVVVRADRTAMLATAALPEVAQILPPMKLEPPQSLPSEGESAPDTVEWGIAKIGADHVWSTYNVTGTGAVVANVDTGVYYQHPALVNQYRGNLGNGTFNHNYNWYDYYGSPAPYPVEGDHGTHTMGTMIGWDGGANQIGVAPGARWIAAYGCCPNNEALLGAEQWIVAPTDLTGANPDPSQRPDANNNSWGGPGGSLIFEKLYAAQRAAGIFVANSAGNNGSACGTLGSPGDTPSAFNTGATDSSDNIASFSSRGPNPTRPGTSPDVSAPGVAVRSSVPPPTNYATYSGTSMASPHVAGAVALLVSLEPKLHGKVSQIEELLRKTADPKTTGSQTCGGVPGTQVPNNTFGWGRINVKAAADMIYHAGWLSGTLTTITNLDATVPVSGALITFSNAAYTYTLTTRATPQGRYNVLAGAGTWNMTVSAYGYTTATANGLVVTRDHATIQDFTLTALPKYTVSGTVRDSVTTAGVKAYMEIAGQDNAQPIWSATNGSYSWQVPQGTYTLNVSHPGYQTYSAQIVVSGNQTLNIDLTSRANYTCLDSRDPGGPVYSWIEASDGTPHNLPDEGTFTASLPGTFTYFGTGYTSVYASSNGFIGFGSATASVNMMVPFEGRPNNEVLGLAEDLNPANGTQGVVYDKTVGTKKIIQYQAVQHWESGYPETFEFVIDTADNSIVVQYKTLSWPDFTSGGLEDSAGLVGQLWSYQNSAHLTNSLAVKYTPASGNAVNWGCDHALWLDYIPSSSIVHILPGQVVTFQAMGNILGQYGAPGVVLTATVPASTTVIEISGGGVLNGGVITWNNMGNARAKASGGAWFRVLPNPAFPPLGAMHSTARLSDSSGEWREDSTDVTVYNYTHLLLVPLASRNAP